MIRLLIFAVSLLSFLNVKAAPVVEGAKNASAPKITLIAPGENDVLQIGKAIHFDMDLDDEILLQSYRVEIHDNFDGHSHTPANEGSPFPSIFDKTWELQGVKKRNIHHHGIVIPADAKEGIYHLRIWCTNANGEQSTVIRTVHLSKGPGTQYHHH